MFMEHLVTRIQVIYIVIVIIIVMFILTVASHYFGKVSVAFYILVLLVGIAGTFYNEVISYFVVALYPL